MKKFNNLINNISKITKINNIYFVKSNNEEYAIKENKNAMIYDYLSSRGFLNYLSPIKSNQDYILLPYINQIETPKDQKAMDIIHLVANLHKKTTYYKEISLDEIKEIYENNINRINYLYEYYSNLQETLEQEEFFSPSTYLLLRNISLIYNNLAFSKDKIDKWYNMVSNNRTIRMSLIHNNLDISHILESNNKYLISWSKAKKDIPIYDLYHFFNNNYNDIDFKDYYKEYINIYPLTKDEKYLLFSIISIPDKVILDNDEYENCLRINKMYIKLGKANHIILDNGSKEQEQKQP